MKHTWTMLLLGASFFVPLTSMKTPAPQPDSTDLKVEITTLDELRVHLTAQNLTGKKLYLSIVMLDRDVLYNTIVESELYTEQISGDIAEISRTLNLSQLESGNYMIKLKAGNKRFERLLDIRTKPADLNDDARIVLFK